MIRAALGVLALIVALTHLPFVVSTLEDIDSVNFALGVRDFDVASHRPHPPGYPIYIGLGKVGVPIARFLSPDSSAAAVEARTLSIVSLIASISAVVLLYQVLSCWSDAARVASPATGQSELNRGV